MYTMPNKQGAFGILYISSKRQGVQSQCKECQKEVNRLWHRSRAGSEVRKKQKERYNSSSYGRATKLIENAQVRLKNEEKFDLTPEWVAKKIEHGRCEVTGIPFDLTPPIGHRRNKYAPSLDRIDNSKGYTQNNVKVVIWFYNMAKNEYSHDELVSFARSLLESENKNA